MSIDSLIAETTIQAGAAGVGGFSLIGLFVWLVKKAGCRLEMAEKDIQSSKLDLANHKIYSEGAYIKKDDVVRLHQRIDDVNRKSDKILEILITNNVK